MSIGITNTIMNDLHISPEHIFREKVSFERLFASYISTAYVEQLADDKCKHQTTHFLSRNDYIKIFSENVVNIVVDKYA